MCHGWGGLRDYWERGADRLDGRVRRVGGGGLTRAPIAGPRYGAPGYCLTEVVDQVVFQQSIPAQIRRLILYNRGQVDGRVGESTYAERLQKPFV